MPKSKYTIAWTCYICGNMRPDRCISVWKHDISAEKDLKPGVFWQNINYCNDNPDCEEKAKTKKYGKISEID